MHDLFFGRQRRSVRVVFLDRLVRINNYVVLDRNLPKFLVNTIHDAVFAEVVVGFIHILVVPSLAVCNHTALTEEVITLQQPIA